jgi:hypothetical protein
MIHQKQTIAVVVASILAIVVASLTYIHYLQTSEFDAKKQYNDTRKLFKTVPMSSITSSISSIVSSSIVTSSSTSVVPTVSKLTSVSTTASNISNIKSIIDTKTVSAAPVVPIDPNCNVQAKINLGIPTSRFLKQLQKYQDICGSKVADKMMVFTQIPSNPNSVQPLVNEIAYILKEFSVYGITPVIIAEPNDGPNMLSFTDFANGAYNPVLDQYFTALKNTGITDRQMGIWVPFPEPNIPVWNSIGSVPSDFGLLINNYSSSLKKQFPTTPVTVLMNYTSFDPSDKSYSSPKISNFDEHLKNIKPGMVNSFGMQGFPWVESNRPSNGSINDPQVFLQPANAMRAANQLGVNTIWFNSGTVSSKYTQQPNLKVDIAPAERRQVNNNKVALYNQIKNAGYKVWVNEFTQDKSNTAEQTNFSYLQTANDQAVFKDFAKKLNDSGISLSLFDSE